MKKINEPDDPASDSQLSHSNSVLETFFIHSLQEMYYAENAISVEFGMIKDQIVSSKLNQILNTHFDILLNHQERLEKIFQLRNETIESRTCETFNALLSEGKKRLSVFTHDIVNWEIALILVSQKLTHYKIASYGGLAHLAIKLNYYKAATLLAISVQEEEEFITNNLDGIIDAFLASHVEGYEN